MDMLRNPVPEKQKTDRQVSTYADGTQICRKLHKPFIHAGFDGWVGYAEWVGRLSIPGFLALRLLCPNWLLANIEKFLLYSNRIAPHSLSKIFRYIVWVNFSDLLFQK